MAAQYIIQLAITEIAGDNPELAALLSLVSMVAISAWDPGVSFGADVGPGGAGMFDDMGDMVGDVTISGATANTSSLTFSGSSFDFSKLLDPRKLAGIALDILSGLNKIALRKEGEVAAELEQEKASYYEWRDQQNDALGNLEKNLIAPTVPYERGLLTSSVRMTNRGAALGGEVTYALFDAQ